jgi:hypothetical protein
MIKVVTLCAEIGHNLDPRKCGDELYKDQWHAPRAEKQLAAYWYGTGGKQAATGHISRWPCPGCIELLMMLKMVERLQVMLLHEGRRV